MGLVNDLKKDVKEAIAEINREEPAQMAIQLSGELTISEEGDIKIDGTPLLPILQNLVGEHITIAVGQKDIMG